MANKIVDVEIPEKLIPYLYTIKDGKTVTDKVTLSIVLGLFASKTITLEKAAELAGKSIWDFIDLLKDYQIPWSEYTDDELKMDESTLSKILGEMHV